MRFERVLLIYPFHKVEWPGLTPPLGLGYVAQSLQQAGVEYDVFDMNVGHGKKDLYRRIDSFRPDLVGMGMITRDYRGFYAILEEIKRQHNGLKIVVGGPHVTIFREKALQECRAVDYGVVREGEKAIVELCDGGTSEGEIEGLLYRVNGDICYSGDRDFEAGLDVIPWPRYERFELDRYFDEISIHTSRGCPYRCIFCARHVLSPKYHARSAANVGEELEYWYRKGYRKFNIEDDNFNMIQRRVYDICDEIDRRGLAGLTLRCSNGLRADKTDRDLLLRMRRAGFRYLAFGVDAGNDRMLKVVNKSETMEEIENAIRIACELGYSIKLFFVVGNPTEERKDVEDMVRLCRKYMVQEVHFNNVVPYPGTELYDWIAERRYFLRQPDEYLNDASFWERRPIFETPEMPEAERVRLTRYLRHVRDEIHRQAIQRMFRAHRVLGILAGRILSNRLLERFYYRRRFWRTIMEGFRYRLDASGKEPAGRQGAVERS